MASAEAAAAAMADVATAIRDLVHVPSRASRGASESIAALIDGQFKTGTDPYGEPWKALKASTIKRKGHAVIGIESSDMRRGIDVKPMQSAGVQITIDADYAAYFQRARPLLPNRGLPVTWQRAITNALSESARDAVQGTGATGSLLDAAAE
jgi:hypothetical protein